MAHGARKWSNIGADEVVHGLADLGEAVARLGSPNTFNREGNLVWMDSFESGLGQWQVATWGTGGEVRLHSEHFRSSGYSCRLAGGSDSYRQACLVKVFPVPVLGRHGFELALNTGYDAEWIMLILSYCDGQVEHQAKIVYWPDAGLLTLRTTDNVVVELESGLYLPLYWSLFHVVKLVADFSANTYVRLILDESEYQLSDYALLDVDHVVDPHVEAMLYVGSLPGKNGVILVDDVILTQNEPP